MIASERDQEVNTVLKTADAMARDGRRPDAIDMMTAANRKQRDPRLEQRLVSLRHNAFTDLVLSPGLAAWPPSPPDLFGGTSGLPEVCGRDLSAETLASGIIRHGCLLVRGLIPPHIVARLKDDIDEVFAALAAHSQGAPVAETTPWFAPFMPAPGYSIGPDRKWVTDGGGVWAVDSPRAMFDVLEAFEEIGLAKPLTGYLGERPALSVKKWTLRRVPTTSGTNWHQDGAFLGNDIRTVNVWLTLSHCGDTAPGLDVVARRFDRLAETGTAGAFFDWSVGEPVVQRVADGAPILRPVFEPGDALLFDNMFLHRTAADPAMTQTRYAIESWFFAPSRYPNDQVPLVF
ncbi:MAG: phytanoyl-CoA dioxygenase family protein [Actinomycetota bacterium]|nr:phytanoyl-CoA dioxygenase family protein [Actinomycetota bacterium]